MTSPLRMCVGQSIRSPIQHRLQGRSEIDPRTIPIGNSRRKSIAKSEQFSIFVHHHPRQQPPSPRFAAENSENTNSHNRAPDVCENAFEKDQEKPLSSTTEIVKRLRRYGVSGILSYGLLNTAYYLTAFLLVWFYVAPAPGKMGYLAAVERFVKIMAMVWAGSQVTKLVRAGGALALAPFVDRGLSWFTAKYKFESQTKAFMAIVGFCFGLAILLFLVVTALSA